MYKLTTPFDRRRTGSVTPKKLRFIAVNYGTAFADQVRLKVNNADFIN